MNFFLFILLFISATTCASDREDPSHKASFDSSLNTDFEKYAHGSSHSALESRDCGLSFVQLKEKLAHATPGSYLVLEQNKTCTFLHIHSFLDKSVILEEVSIPSTDFSRESMNWKVWFEKGAPGHSAWIMSQVNLETGALEETFSFTHKGWIDMSDSNPFLTTLLNLHFRQIPHAERRKVGLPPGYNKADRRPVWNPRLIVNGLPITEAPFYAFKAKWPADGTELSRKTIEIYLPSTQSEEDVIFPSCFPYWIEVEGKIGSVKVRVIDSGMNAHSTKEMLPKRKPQIIGDAQMNEKGLTINIKSPSYYKEFMILAEDSEVFFGNTYPLPCKVVQENGERISLFISMEELLTLPDLEAKYHLIISPKEDLSIALTTPFSLKLN